VGGSLREKKKVFSSNDDMPAASHNVGVSMEQMGIFEERKEEKRWIDVYGFMFVYFRSFLFGCCFFFFFFMIDI